MVKVDLQTGKEAWSFHSIWQLHCCWTCMPGSRTERCRLTCYSLLDYLEASEG